MERVSSGSIGGMEWFHDFGDGSGPAEGSAGGSPSPGHPPRTRPPAPPAEALGRPPMTAAMAEAGTTAAVRPDAGGRSGSEVHIRNPLAASPEVGGGPAEVPASAGTVLGEFGTDGGVAPRWNVLNGVRGLLHGPPGSAAPPEAAATPTDLPLLPSRPHTADLRLELAELGGGGGPAAAAAAAWRTPEPEVAEASGRGADPQAAWARAGRAVSALERLRREVHSPANAQVAVQGLLARQPAWDGFFQTARRFFQCADLGGKGWLSQREVDRVLATVWGDPAASEYGAAPDPLRMALKVVLESLLNRVPKLTAELMVLHIMRHGVPPPYTVALVHEGLEKVLAVLQASQLHAFDPHPMACPLLQALGAAATLAVVLALTPARPPGQPCEEREPLPRLLEARVGFPHPEYLVLLGPVITALAAVLGQSAIGDRISGAHTLRWWELAYTFKACLRGAKLRRPVFSLLSISTVALQVGAGRGAAAAPAATD